jgi:hypothetical protein
MAHYSCYLLDELGHTRRSETIECDGVSNAIAHARSLGRSYSGFEIWDGDRRVHAETSQRTTTRQTLPA